jgi:cellulose synthase operon protein C
MHAIRWMLAGMLVLLTASPGAADEADDQYAVAAGHYDAGRWDLAAEEFQAFLQKFPGHSQANAAMFFRGEALLQKGENEAAEPLLTEYLKREPEGRFARPALFRSGEAAYLAGARDRARPLLEEFQKKYPQDRLSAYVLPYLGDLAQEKNDFPAAEKLFREALERFPDGRLQDDCRLGLARSLEKQQKNEEAERLYLGLAGKTSAALADDAQFRLGAMQYAQKQYAEAAATFQELETKWPKSEWLSSAQLGRGWSLFVLKKYAEAISPLEAYLAENPAEDPAVQALGQLAICYARTGDLGKAKQFYRQLQEKNPQDRLLGPVTEQLAEAALDAKDTAWSAELSSWLADWAKKLPEPVETTPRADSEASPPSGQPADYEVKGLVGLGWSKYQAGKLAEAADTFNQVLEKNPPEPLAAESAYVRGQILEKLGQADPALAMYDNVISRHPNSPQHAEALLAAARLRVKLQQLGEAAALFRKFNEQYPHDARQDAALYEWAWTLADDNQPAEAEKIFQRLKTEFPKGRYGADATYRLAQTAYDAKDYAQAERLIGELFAAKPEPQLREYAAYLRGQIAAAGKDWDKIREIYTAFIEQYPQSPQRPTAEFWIAEADYRQKNY